MASIRTDNTLKEWLEKRYMWISKESDKEKTHNTMDWGTFLSVRRRYYEQFIKLLAKTIKNKGKVYFLEIRTDYFKMMVDLDFKNENGLSYDEKLRLLTLIQEAVNHFIGNQIQDNYVIISACDDEKIMYDGQEMTKIGFHLIWPNLIVSLEEALYIRSAIIQYIKQNIGNFDIFNDWEDVIDKSLYDPKHALRMNGCRKKAKCPTCKNKNKDCGTCFGIGWQDVGRVYEPYLVLRNDCSQNNLLCSDLKEDYEQQLKLTSIRTDEIESNIKINEENFPEWFSEQVYVSHLSRKSKNKRIYKNPEDKYRVKEQNIIPNNDERYIKLKNYIVESSYLLSNKFEETDFDVLKKIKLGKKKTAYIFSTRSHYCLNIRDEHSSNHIYFYIDEKGIYQKCHSPWKNKNGQECTEFISNPIPVNNTIIEMLYDDNWVKKRNKPKKQKKPPSKKFFKI